MIDVVVIGAGVIGTAIARELSRYDLDIVLVEKQSDVANGTTKANSAIVHAGYDAPFDSLKGKTNARGNALYTKVCQDLSVPFDRIGSLVVATEEENLSVLDNLLENGLKLGIEGLEIIDQEKVRAMEPNLNQDIIAALYAPTAGITLPWELANAYAENAMENGVALKLNFDVKDIERKSDRFVIESDKERIECHYVINATGVHAEDLYAYVAEPNFKITPRRGEYYLLDKTADGLVNSVIFNCPSEKGKGVILAPTVDGNVLVGPTSENLGAEMKEATETTLEGFSFIREKAKDLVPNIPFRENITNFAGLRAEPDVDDFIIEESDTVKGFINVGGIKSPGLSAAPAIAEMVVEIVKQRAGELKAKEDFNPYRRPRIKFSDLTNEERSKLIEKDPRYGRIVCRCENITEGEIIDAIHRDCGARTINGIKRRVRPGAGRCQGGFCGPRVAEIIARELNIELTEVLQENEGSNILVSETKN